MSTDGRESCSRFAASSRVRLSKTRSLLIDVCYRCAVARRRAREEGRGAFRFPASEPVNPGLGRCESRTSTRTEPGVAHSEADARAGRAPRRCASGNGSANGVRVETARRAGVYGQGRRANGVRVVRRRTVGPDVERQASGGRRRTVGVTRHPSPVTRQLTGDWGQVAGVPRTAGRPGARQDGPANGVRVRTGRRPGRATPRGRSRAPRRSAPDAAPRPCTPAPRPR